MLDEESKNIFLQNLDEFILDEEKIVTARWLAKTLNISYEDSTTVLTTWILNKKDFYNLLTTYAVTGKGKDGSLKVSVLRDYAVEDFIENLTEVSKCVYSAQKGMLQNIQLLAAVNESFSPCLGGIQGPTAKKRVAPALLEGATDVKPDAFMPKQNGSSIASNSVLKEPESVPASQKLAKSKEISKGGITSFFNKLGAKGENNSSKKKELAQSKTGGAKSMQDFFKKTSPKSPVTSGENSLSKLFEESPTQIPIVKVEIQTEETSCTNEDVIGDIIPATPEVTEVKRTSKKKANKNELKRIRENSDEDNAKKKRKRVYVQSDSSDDDIFGKESEDEKKEECIKKSAFDEPEELEIVEKPVNPNPFKKKKIVDKMYTDEDGFIITRKEIEECSASEEEVEEPPAKKAGSFPPKPLPKKINPGTKQANLMSFFKKK